LFATLIKLQLDYDDFDGSFCNQGPFPFLKATLGHLDDRGENDLISDADIETQHTSQVEFTKRSSTSPFVIVVKPSEDIEPPKQTALTPDEIGRMKQFWLDNLYAASQQSQLNSQAPATSSHHDNRPSNQASFQNLMPSKQEYQHQQLTVAYNQVPSGSHPRESEFLQRLQFETKRKEQEQHNNNNNNHNKQELWLKQLQNHQTEIQRQLEMQNQLQQYQHLLPNQPEYITKPPVFQMYTAAPSPPPQLPQPYQPPQDNNYQFQVQSNSLLDNIKCIGKQNGIYRDELDCTLFYVCETAENNNQPRLHKFACPSGLVFNMQECTCDWPSMLRPCIVPLLNSFCKSSPNIPVQRSEIQPTINDNHQFMASAAPKVQQIPFSCYGKQIGLHRDYYDCKKFYYCQITMPSMSNAYPIVMKHDFVCPSDLDFDITKCRCDWPSTKSCQSIAYIGTDTFCTPSSN
jgi:hypothetical protein